MGLNSVESLDAEEAIIALGRCASNSSPCLKAVLQSSKFKEFLLTSAERIPKILEPFLRDASDACTAARVKSDEQDKTKEEAVDEEKAAKTLAKEERAERESARQEKMKRKLAQSQQEEDASQRAKHVKTDNLPVFDPAEINQEDVPVSAVKRSVVPLLTKCIY